MRGTSSRGGLAVKTTRCDPFLDSFAPLQPDILWYCHAKPDVNAWRSRVSLTIMGLPSGKCSTLAFSPFVSHLISLAVKLREPFAWPPS